VQLLPTGRPASGTIGEKLVRSNNIWMKTSGMKKCLFVSNMYQVKYTIIIYLRTKTNVLFHFSSVQDCDEEESSENGNVKLYNFMTYHIQQGKFLESCKWLQLIQLRLVLLIVILMF
jgi:hypothetical protein